MLCSAADSLPSGWCEGEIEEYEELLKRERKHHKSYEEGKW